MAVESFLLKQTKCLIRPKDIIRASLDQGISTKKSLMKDGQGAMSPRKKSRKNGFKN